MTKLPGEGRMDAAKRAAANPIALEVKLADNLENMDMSRLRATYHAAESIERQLGWCRNYLLGVPQPEAPGPFSMGLIATREFDMYGDRPELALTINDIQRQIKAKLR